MHGTLMKNKLSLSAIAIAVLTLSNIALIGCSQTVQNAKDSTLLESQGANTSVNTLKSDVVNPSNLPNTNNDIKIATWNKDNPDNPSGMVASLEGTLAFKANCIVVISEGGDIVQPVFPSYSVSWDSRKNALIYESKTYKNGEFISLTGGGLVDDTIFRTEKEVNIPECVDTSLFIVAG